MSKFHQNPCLKELIIPSYFARISKEWNVNFFWTKLSLILICTTTSSHRHRPPPPPATMQHHLRPLPSATIDHHRQPPTTATSGHRPPARNEKKNIKGYFGHLPKFHSNSKATFCEPNKHIPIHFKRFHSNSVNQTGGQT